MTYEKSSLSSLLASYFRTVACRIVTQTLPLALIRKINAEDADDFAERRL